MGLNSSDFIGYCGSRLSIQRLDIPKPVTRRAKNHHNGKSTNKLKPMLVSTYSLNLLLSLQVQARQDSAFYPICFAVNLHTNCPFRNSDTNFHSFRSNAKLNKNFTQWEQWGREKAKVLLINFIHGKTCSSPCFRWSYACLVPECWFLS